MFIFHEGLPGSGKSYEAIKEHYLPALEKGIPIYTNVSGVIEGAQKAADAIGKSLAYVQELIHEMTDEDVKNVYKLKHIHDIVIMLDEIQDYWPSNMRNISPEMISYVAKHEHYHHTIIGMGQNLNDVNKVWRNRCARKITFMKREMIGKPNTYTWSAYQGFLDGATSEIKFVKLNSGGGEYESKYFGIYKSTEGDKNKSRTHYADDRTNVLKQKKVIVGIPAFLVIVAFAIYYLVGFFTEPSFATAKQEEKPKIENRVQEPSKSVRPVKQEYRPIDYLDDIAHKYQLRLSAVVYDNKGMLKHAYIDAYDSTQHLKERFFLYDVKALGWTVKQKIYGAELVKQDKRYVVRPWPLDDVYGRVNSHLAQSL